MGQKTNPIGNRIGIIRGWESNWFSDKKRFPEKLIEDTKIRSYLSKRVQRAGVSKIVIERTLEKLIVTIHTSKPGFIIGKGGEEVERLKEEIRKITKGDNAEKEKDRVQINILEVKKMYADARLVADSIVQQIEKRVNYKRAVRVAVDEAMKTASVEGIKVKVGGRLGGAEIARSEEVKKGRVPLHTYRMDIDYASEYAFTVYGKIGVKVWICRGEVLSRRDLDLNFVGNAAFSGRGRIGADSGSAGRAGLRKSRAGRGTKGEGASK